MTQLQIVYEKPHVYVQVKTPESHYQTRTESDAAAIPLLSRRCLGVVVHYACVGILFGGFPRTIYPFLNNYLNMDGYQTTAATQLVLLPWSLKIFISILTDGFPIAGFRRRPYILLGWGICTLCVFTMALLPMQQPFFIDFHDRDTPVADMHFLGNLTALGKINLNAPASGSHYILLMMTAVFGYVIADVAADGYVVQLAQTEPEQSRGAMQTSINLVRYVFQIVAALTAGLSLNGNDYGGDFSWNISFATLMTIIGGILCVVFPMAWFFIHEEKVVREPFAQRIHSMWHIIQQRAIWQVMGYKLLSGICTNWSNVATPIIQREWAHVQPLNDSIAYVVAVSLAVATFSVLKKWGLHWSWRRIIIVTTLCAISIDMIVSLMTVFDLFRNEWFFLGVPLVNEFPEMIRYVIGGYIVVEIADPGYEGLTYGLITTTSTLSNPFSASIYKNINSYFGIFRSDIQTDSSNVRNQTAYAYMLMYAMNVAGLFLLPLLPSQKKEARKLKKMGGSSKIAGCIVICVLLCVLSWGICTNLMSIFPSTACLRISGGDGNC